MLRSMFAGVSGLRSHQTMVDVVGNNIANVNTTGYKSSSVVFHDLLCHVLNGAGAPDAMNGGTNPAAVGLGVKVAGITTSVTQGASQLTGRATDLSIQGDGFFSVRQGNETLYTRAGALDFDAMGRLVTSDGAVVQGWMADGTGAINTNGAPSDLRMPLGQSLAPRATETAVFGGNLDASLAVGESIITGIDVFDDLGAATKISAQFTRTAAGWDLEVDTDADGTYDEGPIALTFDGTTGELTSTIPPITVAGQAITLDFGAPGSANALVQYAGPSSVTAISQDGYELGSLQSFTIGQDGVVTGVFSNGHNRALGQLAIPSFTNQIGKASGRE